MSGIAGMGTKFHRWNPSSSPPKWQSISEVTGIDLSGMKRATTEDTALDTPGGYDTFIAGLRSGGDLKLSMNFSPDTYAIMLADFNSDLKQNYEIIFPDAQLTTFEFEGLVTDCPFKIDKTKITADVTIKISGKPHMNSDSGTSEHPDAT